MKNLQLLQDTWKQENFSSQLWLIVQLQTRLERIKQDIQFLNGDVLELNPLCGQIPSVEAASPAHYRRR